jgi:hypothetical protein
MQGCRTYALPAVIALSGLVLISAPLQAAGPRTATYVTSQACQTQGLLSAEECQNAFANAEAEFEDEAPTFGKQDECERHFRRCVISFSGGQPSSKVLRYVPKMKGVLVTVSAQGRTVVPVLENHHPAVSFSSRTVQDLRDVRSPLRQQEAQTRWAAFQRRVEDPTPVLRGTLDSAFHQNGTGSRFAALAPKLIEWCKQFCGSLPVRGNQASAPRQSSTGLFSPNVDGGAHPEGSVETSRFSRQRGSSTQAQPHFVQKSDAAISSIIADRDADVHSPSD